MSKGIDDDAIDYDENTFLHNECPDEYIKNDNKFVQDCSICADNYKDNLRKLIKRDTIGITGFYLLCVVSSLFHSLYESHKLTSGDGFVQVVLFILYLIGALYQVLHYVFSDKIQ